MRLKSLFIALAALCCATSVAAQNPNILPTSKQPVPKPSAQPVGQVAAPALDPENTLHLDLSTGGRVTIQLRPDIAPNHVARIKALARQGFYNGILFHRVIEGFMAQTGDPTGTGSGGSELPDVAAEFSILPHVRGAVAAARAEDVNSANSQFYIMLAPRFALDGKYTVFGRVVSGMQYVDTIERGEPPTAPSRIVRASIGADNIAPPRPGEVVPVSPAVAAAQAAARSQGATPGTAPNFDISAVPPSAPAPAPTPEQARSPQ